MEVTVLPVVIVVAAFALLMTRVATTLCIDGNVLAVLVDTEHVAAMRVTVREAGRVLLRVGDGVLDLELVLSSYTVPIAESAGARRVSKNGLLGEEEGDEQGVAVEMTVGHLGDIGGVGRGPRDEDIVVLRRGRPRGRTEDALAKE